MNVVQEAIARVTGLDDVLESFSSDIGELRVVNEHLISDNAMLQREIEDLDYLNLYESGLQITEIIPMRDRTKTVARLRRLRQDNPLAKQAVKLIIRFTLGKGIQWVLVAQKEGSAELSSEPDDLGEPTSSDGSPTPTKFMQIPRTMRSSEQIVDTTDRDRDIIEAFWDDEDNKLAFTEHFSMQLMLDDTVTDGEKFYACFESNSDPYLKVTEIPIEEIVQIIYAVENRLRPVYYKRQFQKLEYDGQADQYKPVGQPIGRYYLDYRITEENQAEYTKGIKIPKSKIETTAKIRHVMINPISSKSGRRGLSDLFASRDWFRVFRSFMEGRAAINEAAQSISYKRKVKGGPTAVGRVTGKFGGLSVGDTDANTEISKLTKPLPGAIYDSNQAIDLEWMKTDTGASEAKEDARLILATAGAGVGTMMHYFGEGGDANLATAQSMELPMVKTYEDWQQFIENFFKEWFFYLFRIATDVEHAKEVIHRIGFTFPPIISQDVVKYTTSWAQIVRDIAPNNKVVREQAIRAALSIMGVPNIDGIMPEIVDEMVQAEAMRLEQQQRMAELAASSVTPGLVGKPGGNGAKPPVVGAAPTSGMPPNLQKLASGRGVKASHGPKPE